MDDKDFKDLTDSIKEAGQMRRDDPRLDPKVIATYWAMTGKTEWKHDWRSQDGRGSDPHICWKCKRESYTNDSKCLVPDPIPLSVAELAFFMRDQCIAREWTNALLDIKAHDSPEKWIKAALTIR